ncbi:ABC transporter permease subunit [Planctomycetota bacterium]
MKRTSQAANLLTLARHEVGMHRKSTLAAAVALLAVLAVVLSPARSEALFSLEGVGSVHGILWILLRQVVGLFVVLIPATLFASEARAGTIRLLLALPLSRKALFFGKVLGGVCLSGGILAGLIGADAVMAAVDGTMANGVYPKEITPALVLAGFAAAFSCCAAAGLYTQSTIGGVVLGVVAVILSLGIAAELHGEVQDPWCLAPLVFAAEAVLALSLAYLKVSRLEPRQLET